MKITDLKPETVIALGIVAGVGLLALKLASSGVGGTARDITKGVVGGVFDAAGGIIGGAYEALPNAVKPSSSENVVYRGVNGVGGVLTGDKNFTLGGWIYDITH